MTLRLTDSLLRSNLSTTDHGADGMILRAHGPRVRLRALHRHRDDGEGGMILRFADPAYGLGPCTAIGTMERAA